LYHTQVEVEIRKRKLTQRVKKKGAPARRPEFITKNTEKKTMTDVRMQKMHRLLNENQIPLIPFVVNPKSYSQTIENLFDLSFLVKTGYALIDVQNNELVIMKSDAKAEDLGRDFTLKEIHAKQSIIKFNYQTFMRCIDAYHLTYSKVCVQIPTRTLWKKKSK